MRRLNDKYAGAPSAWCAFRGKSGRQTRRMWEGAAARRPPVVSGLPRAGEFVFVCPRVNASPAACGAVRGVVVRAVPVCILCTYQMHIMNTHGAYYA